MKKKALIAMSGGVDSSVAAFLMQKNGYHTREYAFVCVYGHIMRANMHIYAKYNIKNFC